MVNNQQIEEIQPIDGGGVVETLPPAQQHAPKPSEWNNVRSSLWQLCVIPLSLLHMEFLTKMWLFGNLFDEKFVYLAGGTLFMGFGLSAVTLLFEARARRNITRVILGMMSVLFSLQIIYHNNFKSMFSWATIGQAGDVMQFWKEALGAALGVWFMVLAMFLPFELVCAFGKSIFPDRCGRNLPMAAIGALAALLPYSFLMGKFIQMSGWDTSYTPYYYYAHMENDPEQTFQYYGILNATRLEFKHMIFGKATEELEEPDLDNIVDLHSLVSPTDTPAPDDSDLPKEYGSNVMDIDFDAAAQATSVKTLKSMDKYFSSLTPTKKNAYTGYFKDKNLIFISLEGYSYKVIDPELTPTLYKMANEGFVFNNFYNSLWGGSTATGEYANMTGNFYLTANCLKLSADTYQPFALGNQFRRIGYKTVAYHNNSYTYYGRDRSHPNFGYDYTAIGNGLKLKGKHWPNSDKEMAEATADWYIGTGEKFHAYYMSVSGHANYSASANAMSNLHLKDLPEKYKKSSPEVRAYLACQYEVELMLQVLVQKLEAAGELENTVFAMNADHYPYALSDDALAELYGLSKSNIRKQSELYRNSFILWCASMPEPVVIDAPCSSIDIVPTISNLFGLEYDSRVIMGSDILCEGDHFALLKLNGWSWVSTQGEYIANRKKFIPNDNCTMSDEEIKAYVDAVNTVVKAKTTYSLQILDRDYYRHIFPS